MIHGPFGGPFGRPFRSGMLPAAPVTLASALLLAACGAAPTTMVKNAPPTIGQVLKQEKKSPQQVQTVPLTPSDPAAPDPQKALDNYRKLLELNPDEATRAEALRRMADLQVQTDDLKGGDADSPQTLAKSIAAYEQLLRERPGDAANDRVLYQMARAQQNASNSDGAIDTLARLNREFPQSNLGGDAHFRRAELLFLRQRFAEAEQEYRIVVELADGTPFFEIAQYKYGWSQYKQAKYDAAVGTFFAVLERELPPGEIIDADASLSAVKKSKVDLVKDSLRVVSLSFAVQGGGQAANDYFARHGDTRFFPAVYDALGKLLIEKLRYTDAAEAYAAFTQRYAQHALAPTFQSKVIAAYQDGGFPELVVREKERYAGAYDPQAAYWSGRAITPEVRGELRKNLEDLARYYHARAQAAKPAVQADFLTAGRWYKRILELYADDPKIAEIAFLYGDALLDGGKTREAAEQYARTAYDYRAHPRAADAALASYQAWRKYAGEVPAAERPTALRLAVDAGNKLSERFVFHPEKLKVLIQVAQDLLELKSLNEAIATADRVLKNNPPPLADQQRIAYSVIGDAQFAQQHYAEAETAFAQELKLTPAEDKGRAEIVEQLAASVYKQGEAARDAGDLRRAVNHFLRLGDVAPTASIRVNAEYDAGAALMQLEDWSTAAAVLETFRTRYPKNQYEADVDKKLAVAYQKGNQPARAADAYSRIAGRTTEDINTRGEAAWLAATLYDQAKQPAEATNAYRSYVGAYPQPLDRSLQARQRLVDYARERNDLAQQRFWLNEIVRADENGGTQRSDATRALAARSALELGRFAAADAGKLKLTAPVEKSLPQKKAAMEAAITSLNKAAAYNFADVTTAATYELGQLYLEFAKSLNASERPKSLSALELEQYNLLLEEQSFPFEEKGIAALESNLRRIPQGIYDDWVAKSYQALAQLAPARYAKREKGEEFYESLN